MNIFDRAISSPLRTGLFFALSATVAASALASTGSTDLYAPNGITASFATSSATPVVAYSPNGSTDLYGANGFRASFGPADSSRVNAELVA
jgi:hypothetical protein